MFRILSRLFGSKQAKDAPRPNPSARSISAPAASSRGDRVTPAYYETMAKLQRALSSQDFAAAAAAARENVRQIPQWVKEQREEYGGFLINSIPALEQGGTALALRGDDDGLNEICRVVDGSRELEPWRAAAEQHQKDRILFDAILEVVNVRPGCLQTEVKGLVGVEDGHRVAVLISYLERAGKIARIKAGRTYQLVPPDSAAMPAPPPKRIVISHRTDRTPPRLREIDISKLAYVPLPRSPLRWEETRAGRERTTVADASGRFEVRDADWRIASVEKIPTAERPDTAFSQIYPRDSGTLLIDPSGKAEGMGSVEAAALRYNRKGELVTKAGLKADVYRIGVHPLGIGMIAMSRDCVLHAYDDDLKQIIETPLNEAPEIRAIRKRFEINDGELKNHIRCVGLSRNAGRYLFTAVDEAWCVDAQGKGLWGAKLPIKEGWARATTPSGCFGTSAQVDSALALMSLMLPITPEDLKRRYRELAKQWHPDLNPNASKAEEKMKALNAAAEVLTGVDAAALPRYTGATFVHELHRQEIEAGGLKLTMTIGMQVSERFASDWVYAASFAGESDSVYLAGYSGRVVLVDDNGVGVRVYDIGAVPRRIVDTGSYLYLLTDTRLYVLRNDALHALVDVFDGGDLVVAQTGFGLLEKKRLRWYSAGGKYVGSVVAKDPIRRVYWAYGSMVVETRQSRAVIEGVPNWWRGEPSIGG